jgi:hypothetical protein
MRKPPIGTVVEVEYEPIRGQTERKKTVFEVTEHTDQGFVGGAGIGNRVTETGKFFVPSSSSEYHAEKTTRHLSGVRTEWRVIDTETPD